MSWRWRGDGSGAVGAALVFVLNYNFILNHFFREGAYLLDTALFGGLIHDPSVALYYPAVFTGGDRVSYYVTHFHPLLYLLGIPSLLVSTNFIYYAATFFAGQPAFLAALMAILVRELDRLGRLRCGAAGLAALMFAAPLALALSGPVMTVVTYPHMELLFAPLAGLFFLFTAQKRFIAATTAFALCVIAREDFVLHLFGFLLVWITYQIRVERGVTSALKPWLSYLAAAAVVGIALLLIQHVFMKTGKALAAVYLGSPIYSHVTVQLIAERIEAVARTRADLIVCVFSAVVLSAWLRDLRYLLGYLACGPWLIFSLLARTEPAGTLALHYGFPFVLAMIWPLLALFMPAQRLSPDVARWRPGRGTLPVATAVVVLTLLGFAGSTIAYLKRPGADAVVASMRAVPVELQTAGVAFQGLLAGGLLDRERIGVDSAVAALMPKAVRRDQLADAGDPRRFRAVAFYATSLGSEQTIEGLIDAGFSQSWRVGASSLYVAARPSAGGDLARTLQSSGLGAFAQSYLMPRMIPGRAGRKWLTSVATNDDSDGLVMFGPNVGLAVGTYRVEYACRRCNARDPVQPDISRSRPRSMPAGSC